ncbi:DUF4148 domain-containing protein [Bordetella trematum]|uniref:DUF4148 domain-containing protein n=1 Tax=Bordetella trematum TaxID=123899 RepID=UPI0009ECDCBD|nr:DUF4148 domain-containing protein [Bordetella trematum]
MNRAFLIAAALLAAATASAHASPPLPSPEPRTNEQKSAPGKTREQVIQELVAACKAGELWHGNAEPPAFRFPARGRVPICAAATVQDAPSLEH